MITDDLLNEMKLGDTLSDEGVYRGFRATKNATGITFTYRYRDKETKKVKQRKIGRYYGKDFNKFDRKLIGLLTLNEARERFLLIKSHVKDDTDEILKTENRKHIKQLITSSDLNILLEKFRLQIHWGLMQDVIKLNKSNDERRKYLIYIISRNQSEWTGDNALSNNITELLHREEAEKLLECFKDE